MWTRGSKGFGLVCAASVALTLLGACNDNKAVDPGKAEDATFERSEATTVADFKLVDFAFDGPLTVTGPKVFFTATNQGSQNHELEVLDSAGKAVGEIPSFAVGATAEPLAAALSPGTYTLQCILETPEGKEHKDLGMLATLTVK